MKISPNPIPKKVLWRLADVMEYLGVSRKCVITFHNARLLKKVFLCCLCCSKKKSCTTKKKEACLRREKPFYRRSDIVKIVKGIADG